ncbi:hypothetical protein [Parapedobacter tibetensis]|nr:hypothetical protein [Parapedobacter tibetensis]
MKRIALICFLLSMTGSVRSQQLEMRLDSVLPLLETDRNGDTIRKYFRYR